MSLFKAIKEKIQFRKFYNGYYAGYKEGAKRCYMSDGRFLRLSMTDMNVYSDFSKHPNKNWNWLYRPWREGFDFGYTEALGFYNSGDDPNKNGDSYYAQDIRVKQEFEKLKEDF